MDIRLKRVYDPPEPGDGQRFLVDRLWPRGLSKNALSLDGWLKELAPSDALRRWFGHEPARWEEFRKRYRQELVQKAESLARLRAAARRGTITLVYAARDPLHNQAVVLREVLLESPAPTAAPTAPQPRPGPTTAQARSRSRTRRPSGRTTPRNQRPREITGP